jgi:hypothetical protein
MKRQDDSCTAKNRIAAEHELQRFAPKNVPDALRENTEASGIFFVSGKHTGKVFFFAAVIRSRQFSVLAPRRFCARETRMSAIVRTGFIAF